VYKKDTWSFLFPDEIYHSILILPPLFLSRSSPLVENPPRYATVALCCSGRGIMPNILLTGYYFSQPHQYNSRHEPDTNPPNKAILQLEMSPSSPYQNLLHVLKNLTAHLLHFIPLKHSQFKSLSLNDLIVSLAKFYGPVISQKEQNATILNSL
jgi:hypothetical protein